jgi:hypothetical protein
MTRLYSKKKLSKLQSRKTFKKSNTKSKSTKITNNNLNVNTFTNKFKNVNINFTTYNQGQLPNTKKYKVISMCYFIIENSTALQKSKKYLKGMNNLINTVKKSLRDYKIRIYCDKPAFAKLKKYLTDNKVEIFVFNIPVFYSNPNNNKSYHKGYIGTLLRYFPAFNIPEHKVDTMVSVDIDNALTFELQKLIKYKLPNINMIVYSHTCYHRVGRFDNMGRLDYSMMGGLVCVNTKKLCFPKYLLDEFLNDYLLHNNLHYETYLKLFLNYKYNKEFESPQIENRKENKHIKDISIAKFVYGVDEYFLNNQIRRYLMLNNIPIYYYTFSSQLGRVFNYLIKSIYLSKNVQLNKDFANLFKKYLSVFPYAINQYPITNENDFTQYYKNNHYFALGFRKLESISNKKIYNEKINKINKEVYGLVLKYFKELGYVKRPGNFTCVKYGLLHNYNSYLQPIKIKYTFKNTSFVSPKLIHLEEGNVKDLNINIPKVINYAKSKQFINFKK